LRTLHAPQAIEFGAQTFGAGGRDIRGAFRLRESVAAHQPRLSEDRTAREARKILLPAGGVEAYDPKRGAHPAHRSGSLARFRSRPSAACVANIGGHAIVDGHTLEYLYEYLCWKFVTRHH